MKRNLGIVLCLVCAGYVALTGALYVAMKQPPDRFGAIMAKAPAGAMMILPFKPLWKAARAGSLREGDAAPDFILPTTDRSRQVQFAEVWRERPVALVFGSYT